MRCRQDGSGQRAVFKMIEAIIFDADGVVIDTEPIWDRCMEEFLKRRGFTYDRGKFKHLLGGRSPVEGVRILQEAYGFEGTPEELAKERSAIAKKHFRNGVKFVTGFQEFYTKVRGLCKTCIATSLDRRLLEIADQQLRIFSLFLQNVFSIADVGYVSKPNADLFLYSAARLKSEPTSCVVIEDSPNGIEAARRAGMSCIALTTTYTRDKLLGASTIVDSYSQLDLSQFRNESPTATPPPGGYPNPATNSTAPQNCNNQNSHKTTNETPIQRGSPPYQRRHRC